MLQSDGCYYYAQQWRPLVKRYEVKADVVCLQVKLCDLHLSALEMMFSRQGAIQIFYLLPILTYTNKQYEGASLQQISGGNDF